MNTLVVFDLGRVLLEICGSWQEACARAGVDLPRNWPAAAAAVHPLHERFEVGDIAPADFCAALAHHGQMHEHEALAALRAYIIAPYEGVGPLLADLRTAGCRVACLSNTNAVHWAQMYEPGHPACLPMHLFDGCFASQEIGRRKPQPQAYAYVEKAMQAAPAEICYFDDLADNITGAAARGWQTAQVPIGGNPLPWIRQQLVQWQCLPAATNPR